LLTPASFLSAISLLAIELDLKLMGFNKPGNGLNTEDSYIELPKFPKETYKNISTFIAFIKRCCEKASFKRLLTFDYRF